MKNKGSVCVLDLDESWMKVDSWETSGVVTAAEAREAERDAQDAKRKLEEEEKKHALLAQMAKNHMQEMTILLEGVKLSSATRDEMARVEELNSEIERLKANLSALQSAIESHTKTMVESLSKSRNYEKKKVSKEVDIKSVLQTIRDAETVDLAFLLDCTGSMHPHIEAAKKCIKDVVRRVKRTNKDLSLRVALVGYRDIYNGDKRFEVLDFTASIEEFESFVSSLRPISNTDPPEDLAGAVQKANELSWQQVTRVAFVIADWPCHGSQYHEAK